MVLKFVYFFIHFEKMNKNRIFDLHTIEKMYIYFIESTRETMIAKLLVALGFLVILTAEVEGIPLETPTLRQADDRSPLESPILNTLPQADDCQKKQTSAAYDTAKAATKPLGLKSPGHDRPK